MSIWLDGWCLGLNIYKIFLVLGFLYSRLNDLLDADPNTKAGRIELPLSLDNLLHELPSFETFLMLSYLLPRDVLDCLSVSGSTECETPSSILYLDLGNNLEKSFLSVGIFIVFSKFWAVLLFFNGSFILDFGG